jgi:hypothetical protein
MENKMKICSICCRIEYNNKRKYCNYCGNVLSEIKEYSAGVSTHRKDFGISGKLR